MIEPKISLSLLVQGATMLSSQECEKNPKESYNEHIVTLEFPKGKGKQQRTIKKTFKVQTRKSKLITQNINLCEDAYYYMINNATDPKLIKKWPHMSIDSRLKAHFDLIAHDLRAVSYDYKVLDD